MLHLVSQVRCQRLFFRVIRLRPEPPFWAKQLMGQFYSGLALPGNCCKCTSATYGVNR